MVQAIRHGDMCLVKVESIPNGLSASDRKTLMRGSHGNNHDVANGEFYAVEESQFVFGYLRAMPKCKLLHSDHGKGKGPIKISVIPEGIYQLRRQFEHTNEAMKPVVD